ncbi:MAG: hypothetical protein ACRECH_10650, partial [Nitrososphaerales archaeon]
MRVLVRKQEPNCADCGLAVFKAANLLDSLSDKMFAGEPAFDAEFFDIELQLKKAASACKVKPLDDVASNIEAARKSMKFPEAIGELGTARTRLRDDLERYGTQAFLDPPREGQTGAAVGALAASAAVTAAESPELIPFVAPVGRE